MKRQRHTRAKAAPPSTAAPPPVAGLADLPPDVISHIAQLGFTSKLSPMFDRGDLLLQACSLACVGNSACTALAGELFAALSPRLGQPLPEGTSERSTIPALKAALKAWGLPVSGSKGVLYQRLMDEVEDSEVNADDEPLSHCLVSGATRRELAGARHRRISEHRAKSVFTLCKYELEQLESSMDYPAAGGRGLPTRTYLLSDVKALALRLKGDWDQIAAKKQRDKEEWAELVRAEEERRKQRREDLEAELARRGRSVQDVEDILAAPAMDSVMWGTREQVELGAAADWLERMHWAAEGPRAGDFFDFLEMGEWEPPAHMSQYKAKEMLWDNAAHAAIRVHLEEAASPAELQADATIPASLLPEMLNLWGEVQQEVQQQAFEEWEAEQQAEGVVASEDE